MIWLSNLLSFLSLVVLVLAVASPFLRRRSPRWHWYLCGYPVKVLQIVATWRRTTTNLDLAVERRPSRLLLGGVLLRGDPWKPMPPRLGVPWPVPGGLVVNVKLHPGQVPDQYMAAADALLHAWRMHTIRVVSHTRGRVQITALATDPLTNPVPPSPTGSVPEVEPELLAAEVGVQETGEPWVVRLRDVPHWLVTGATRSGKSTFIAQLVGELGRQPVALVGIDCKGGVELSLFESRLSALATCRREAVGLLDALVEEITRRMLTCRHAGVRSVWDLPDTVRPVPVVVLVDEVAELYLTDGSRDAKAEAARCSSSLLRLAQLGAGLGVHLVVSGQRVGSDLGPGVVALRAQLAGRVCHRVSDPSTAEMTLGDLLPDAVEAAQSISWHQPGVAVTTDGCGGWVRVRSHVVTAQEAQTTAQEWSHMAPHLSLPGQGSGSGRGWETS